MNCVGGSVSAVTFSTGTGGTLAGEACMFTYSACSHILYSQDSI